MPLNTWTRIVAASGVIAVAGSTFVYAQQSGPSDWQSLTRLERYRPTAEDFGAYIDARIAAIKAGLRLNAEQEKNWPAFEEAYRNLAKMRTDRILAFREGPPPPPSDMVEGLQRRADLLGRSATALRQIADATAPLYKSLDEAQKRRFAVLTPMLRRQGGINLRRGDNPRRGQENMRREGQAPEQRGTDRRRLGDGSSRGGAMERIRFGSDPDHDYSAEPGVGVARENGWR